MQAADLRFVLGAAEGNRTLMTSLEGCGGDLADQQVRSSGG